jgi:hypothetical protein
MTGHKDGSHMATKAKRIDVTEQKHKRKALKPAPVASLTAAPIITPRPSSRRPKKKKRVVDPNNLASLHTFRVAVSKTILVKHMEKLQVSRDSLITSIVMLHELLATLPTIPAVVDVSGRRVSAYMDLVCTAYEIRCQRRFLSCEAFHFLPFEDEPAWVAIQPMGLKRLTTGGAIAGGATTGGAMAGRLAGAIEGGALMPARKRFV